MWQDDSDHKVTDDEGLQAIRMMAAESLSSTELGKLSKVVDGPTLALPSPSSLGTTQLGPPSPLPPGLGGREEGLLQVRVPLVQKVS